MSIFTCHQIGIGFKLATNFSPILGVQYMIKYAYELKEEDVGVALMQVREEYLAAAIDEEKQLKKESYTSTEDMKVPACTFGINVAWNKRHRGQFYDSATGTVNTFRLLSRTIHE